MCMGVDLRVHTRHVWTRAFEWRVALAWHMSIRMSIHLPMHRNSTLGGLDETLLEQYLDDREFVATLCMSKAEFYNLPKWKSDS